MKKYEVIARKIIEIAFEVGANNEEDSIDIVQNIVEENDILSFENGPSYKEKIEYEALEIREIECRKCKYFCSVCKKCNYYDYSKLK